MKLLLDTCVLLWLIGAPERLPGAVRALAERRSTKVRVSTVSLWEILLKQGKGGIRIDSGGRTVHEFMLDQCEAHQLELLAVRAETLHPLERLPALHRDPFDRLLICQAIDEGLTLVTPDTTIRRYPIKTLWDD